MNLIDLSHPLKEGMPVYPGTEAPSFQEANTIEKDGFREKLICMYSHTGTHMDAPAHILPGAQTLDRLPIDTFAGPALVLDVTGGVMYDGSPEGFGKPGGTIGLSFLIPWKEALDKMDFLLLRSGWDGFWGRKEYFETYPTLTSEAAEWLTGRGLKGLGFDCISADPVEANHLPVHRILLGSGMVLLENLKDLDRLPVGKVGAVHFTAMPLAIADADGSPVRAFAELL